MPRNPNQSRAKPRTGRAGDRHELAGRIVRLHNYHWQFLSARAKTTKVSVTAQIRDLVERAYRASL